METKAKTKYRCVSGFSSEKTRYGGSALTFYFIKIFYIEIAVFCTFSPIFQHIRQYFAHNSNKMFRVGTKT